MPRGDRTGPNGMGSMTGRAAGFCAGFDQPGFTNQAGGRGMGRGFGMSRGFGMGFGRGFRGSFRGGFGAPGAYYGEQPFQAASSAMYPDRNQELSALKEQSEFLKQNMDNINKRIADLESEE